MLWLQLRVSDNTERGWVPQGKLNLSVFVHIFKTLLFC